MKTILVIGLLFLVACSNTISGGHGLGQDSRFAMDKTFNETLELAKSGHTQTWYNAQTNTSGTITVISTYVLHGRHCRECKQNSQTQFSHCYRKTSRNIRKTQ